MTIKYALMDEDIEIDCPFYCCLFCGLAVRQEGRNKDPCERCNGTKRITVHVKKIMRVDVE